MLLKLADTSTPEHARASPEHHRQPLPFLTGTIIDQVADRDTGRTTSGRSSIPASNTMPPNYRDDVIEVCLSTASAATGLPPAGSAGMQSQMPNPSWINR
ncbi:hypothetical protein [Nocardia rhamnosiphila]